MRQLLILALTFFLLHQGGRAQSFEALGELKNHSVRVLHSKGHEQRARTIAGRVDKAMAYYQQLLQFRPSVTLLVLSQADWSRYTFFPVYGMPHFTGDSTLVVAAEDNAFWKSFLPPLEQLPADLRPAVQATYRQPDGSLSMEAFFDLLALHELGHAFHFQGGLNLQRKWMGELFVNILLHTYVAEKEPGSLPALTLFPRMVVSGGTKEFTYTSLTDIEARYEEIGQRHPKNYGWYQSRWHSAAAGIYEAAGPQIGPTLWAAFRKQNERLDDEALAAFLDASGAKAVADMMRHWDRDTVR